MGTGTKIGLVLVLVLAVVLIANLLDREVDRAPSAREQITGRIASRGLRPVVEERTPRIVTETKKPAESQDGNDVSTANSRISSEGDEAGETGVGVSTEKAVTNPVETGSARIGDERATSEEFGQPVPSVARLNPEQRNSALGVIDGNGERRSITSDEPTQLTSVPGFPKIHTIVDGESLWQIAETYYSRGHLYRAILDANPSLGSGELLAVGTTIQIPALSASVAPAAVASSRRSASPPLESGLKRYRIRKGDTLYEISEALLGDGLRWREIQKLNPNLNAGSLRIGQVITVPTGN